MVWPGFSPTGEKPINCAPSPIFTTRRHASAVLCCRHVSVRPVLCPSVCPSQSGIAWKRVNESSWYLRWGLPSTYTTLCWKEIFVSPTIRLLPFPSGTLSQTSDLENFAAASRLHCQQLVVVVVDGRVCWRHIYDSRWVLAVYYKSINCNPLTPFDLLWILSYSLFLELTRFWMT